VVLKLFPVNYSWGERGLGGGVGAMFRSGGKTISGKLGEGRGEKV
jgi:hypothetical protein